MRLTSLILLAAIVGGAGYVLIFKRDWLSKAAKTGLESAEGYFAAKTPQEAMDYFQKAVQARKYDTASKYCSGDYAEQLRRAHAATSPYATVLDEINDYAKNKGYNSANTTTLLMRLDPFPTNFKVKDPPKLKDDKAKAAAHYTLEVVPDSNANLGNTHSINAVDPRMFKWPLVPANLFDGFELIREGKEDEPSWKLNLGLRPGQVDDISVFITNYKSYYSGLTEFRKGATNDRHASKKDFERELFKTITDAK